MQVQESSFTQLPNEYMQVHCGRYTDAGGDSFFQENAEKCIHTGAKWQTVKMQVEINLFKDNYNFVFSTFSRRAPGQHGLMSTKRSPLARHVDRHNRHTLRSNCNVGLCWANPFPRNASQKNCDFAYAC